MASDGRFYKRFNYESVAMEEYEVRDVANRWRGPDLRIDARVKQGDSLALAIDEGTSRSQTFPIQFDILNESTQVAEHRIVRVYVDKRLVTSPSKEDGFIKVGEQLLAVQTWTQNQSPTSHMPICQGVRFLIHKVSLSVPSPDVDADYVLAWTIDAPGMSTRGGWVILRLRNGRLHLLHLQNTEEVPSSLHGLPE
jgi:hypothetical protein